MRALTLLFLCSVLGASLVFAQSASPPQNSLLGSWDGSLDIGKTKLHLVLTIATNAGDRISATIDVPDQGAKGLPVDAVLFNPPDVRFEFDTFNARFTGTLSKDGQELKGVMEGGPRPNELVFKKVDPASLKAKELVYGYQPGEKKDLHGYWQATVTMMGSPLLVNMMVGKAADGSYELTMAIPELGLNGAKATLTNVSPSAVSAEWPMMRGKFEAKLDEKGDLLSGPMQFGPVNQKANFKRLDKIPGPIPEGTSFVAKDATKEPTGYWKGTLSVGQNSLKLAFQVGQTPEGKTLVLMDSLSQGAKELPASAATLTNNAVFWEWKRINGAFAAKLSADGMTLNGEWTQGGGTNVLNLSRATKEDFRQ
jgi:hypothetical protein